MIYDLLTDLVIYVCLPMMIVGSVVMIGLLPYQIKRAIEEAFRDEPPRRRATDVKRGTPE